MAARAGALVGRLREKLYIEALHKARTANGTNCACCTCCILPWGVQDDQIMLPVPPWVQDAKITLESIMRKRRGTFWGQTPVLLRVRRYKVAGEVRDMCVWHLTQPAVVWLHLCALAATGGCLW
jgi:hypothetical protein